MSDEVEQPIPSDPNWEDHCREGEESTFVEITDPIRDEMPSAIHLQCENEAMMTATYYKTLVREGIPPKQSKAFTHHWMDLHGEGDE